MEINYIKIMPEIGCYPIWVGVDGNIKDTVEIESICNDLVLIKEFNTWDSIFQNIYDLSDPESAGFDDKESLIAFERQGICLWNKLSILKPDVKIEYFSFVFDRVYDNILELQNDLDNKAIYMDSFIWIKP
jgi:hypothetical protein